MKPIQPRPKYQVIDLTEYCTGRINKRRRRVGLWFFCFVVAWLAILTVVAAFVM